MSHPTGSGCAWPAAKKWRGHRAPDLFHPDERGYARIAALFTTAALSLDYP